MAVLTTKARKAIPASKFALPGRRFPIQDRVHAAKAKARATQGLKNGTLSKAEHATVIRKANAVLKRTAPKKKK